MTPTSILVSTHQVAFRKAGLAVSSAALGFAARYHKGQRLDGSPEISHQIQIATYLESLGPFPLQDATVATACLHDVREDYGVADCVIRSLFGDTIAGAVDLVTKTFRGVAQPLPHAFRLPARCPIAAIVKGGDRIHNLRTMDGAFCAAKKRSYRQETRNHILPMLRTAILNHPSFANILLRIIEDLEVLSDPLLDSSHRHERITHDA